MRQVLRSYRKAEPSLTQLAERLIRGDRLDGAAAETTLNSVARLLRRTQLPTSADTTSTATGKLILGAAAFIVVLQRFGLVRFFHRFWQTENWFGSVPLSAGSVWLR